MSHPPNQPTWDKPLPLVADEFGPLSASSSTSASRGSIEALSPLSLPHSANSGSTAWRRPSAPAVVYHPHPPSKGGRLSRPFRNPPRQHAAGPYLHAAGAMSMPQLVAGPASPTFSSIGTAFQSGRADARRPSAPLVGSLSPRNSSVVDLVDTSAPALGPTDRIGPLLEVLGRPGLQAHHALEAVEEWVDMWIAKGVPRRVLGREFEDHRYRIPLALRDALIAQPRLHLLLPPGLHLMPPLLPLDQLVPPATLSRRNVIDVLVRANGDSKTLRRKARPRSIQVPPVVPVVSPAPDTPPGGLTPVSIEETSLKARQVLGLGLGTPEKSPATSASASDRDRAPLSPTAERSRMGGMLRSVFSRRPKDGSPLDGLKRAVHARDERVVRSASSPSYDSPAKSGPERSAGRGPLHKAQIIEVLLAYVTCKLAASATDTQGKADRTIKSGTDGTDPRILQLMGKLTAIEEAVASKCGPNLRAEIQQGMREVRFGMGLVSAQQLRDLCKRVPGATLTSAQANEAEFQAAVAAWLGVRLATGSDRWVLAQAMKDLQILLPAQMHTISKACAHARLPQTSLPPPHLPQEPPVPARALGRSGSVSLARRRPPLYFNADRRPSEIAETLTVQADRRSAAAEQSDPGRDQAVDRLIAVISANPSAPNAREYLTEWIQQERQMRLSRAQGWWIPAPGNVLFSRTEVRSALNSVEAELCIASGLRDLASAFRDVRSAWGFSGPSHDRKRSDPSMHLTRRKPPPVIEEQELPEAPVVRDFVFPADAAASLSAPQPVRLDTGLKPFLLHQASRDTVLTYHSADLPITQGLGVMPRQSPRTPDGKDRYRGGRLPPRTSPKGAPSIASGRYVPVLLQTGGNPGGDPEITYLPIPQPWLSPSSSPANSLVSSFDGVLAKSLESFPAPPQDDKADEISRRASGSLRRALASETSGTKTMPHLAPIQAQDDSRIRPSFEVGDDQQGLTLLAPFPSPTIDDKREVLAITEVARKHGGALSIDTTPITTDPSSAMNALSCVLKLLSPDQLNRVDIASLKTALSVAVDVEMARNGSASGPHLMWLFDQVKAVLCRPDFEPVFTALEQRLSVPSPITSFCATSDRLPSSISTTSQSTLAPNSKRGTFGVSARSASIHQPPPPPSWTSKGHGSAIILDQSVLLSASPSAVSPDSEGAAGSLYFDALTHARNTPVSRSPDAQPFDAIPANSRVVSHSRSMPSTSGASPDAAPDNISAGSARSPSPSFSLDSAFARQGTSPRDSALASLQTSDGRSLYSHRASLEQSIKGSGHRGRPSDAISETEPYRPDTWRSTSPLTALLSLEQTWHLEDGMAVPPYLRSRTDQVV